MNNRLLYSGSVLTLLAAALSLTIPKGQSDRRVQQHLTYNQTVEDTSQSIQADSFSTRLPIIRILTNSQVTPTGSSPDLVGGETKNQSCYAKMQIFAQEGVCNTLESPPALESFIRIQSFGPFDRAEFRIYLTDPAGNKKIQPVLGMEASDEWILHGPYPDKTLMRDYMWYNLSGQIMEWAPDVRYCEVFLDDTYQGIYVCVEPIGPEAGQASLTPYRDTPSACSYILRTERTNQSPYQILNQFTRYARLMYPDSVLEVTYPVALTPQLLNFINRDFSQFEKSLYSYDYDSRQLGYARYIDVDNFVDYFIINEVIQNTDAGIFSTYFYKDMGGKLKLSVWDFDYICDNKPNRQIPLDGFFMQNRTWYDMLLKDRAFVEKIIRRYEWLRQGILSDQQIQTYIVQVQDYLEPALHRNFIRLGSGNEDEDLNLLLEDSPKISHQAAMDQYSNRLLKRMDWMDHHMKSLYAYSDPSFNKKFNH